MFFNVNISVLIERNLNNFRQVKKLCQIEKSEERGVFVGKTVTELPWINGNPSTYVLSSTDLVWMMNKT